MNPTNQQNANRQKTPEQLKSELSDAIRTYNAAKTALRTAHMVLMKLLPANITIIHKDPKNDCYAFNNHDPRQPPNYGGKCMTIEAPAPFEETLQLTPIVPTNVETIVHDNPIVRNAAKIVNDVETGPTLEPQ